MPFRTLIFQGGWSGHEPEAVSAFFADQLDAKGSETCIRDSLDVLDDLEFLKQFQLIIPCWSMGQITPTQSRNLQSAILSGIGLAGFHGGMGDAFRGDIDYEWMVGGHFVGHPHVGPYTVRIDQGDHPITQGSPESFVYDSEQYYMLVDPGNKVLATTEYTYENATVAMPVLWTKLWGKGRIFYSALGHQLEEFTQYPQVNDLTLRGLLWAAKQI